MNRFIKYASYITLTLILVVNLFILLSGRFYLYSGISKTYLIGKTAPGIYDLDVFPVNTVEKSTTPNEIKVKSGQNVALTENEEEYLSSIDTRAFLVFENDTLLHEQYWEEHSVNQVSNSFSASKTVIGLLIGIAIEEGKIPSVDEPIFHYLPEFKTNGRDVLTIRHLLLTQAARQCAPGWMDGHVTETVHSFLVGVD